MRPRAAAEPWIDAWLSQLLPDPAKVICDVSYHDAGGDHSRQVSLRDLNVRPHDVLAMADVGSTPQKGELETRILFAAALPADATNVAIDFAPASLPPGTSTFPDAFFLAKSLRTLISSARALAPQDMTVPEVDAGTAGGVVDLADLRARGQRCRRQPAERSAGADHGCGRIARRSRSGARRVVALQLLRRRGIDSAVEHRSGCEPRRPGRIGHCAFAGPAEESLGRR